MRVQMYLQTARAVKALITMRARMPLPVLPVLPAASSRLPLPAIIAVAFSAVLTIELELELVLVALHTEVRPSRAQRAVGARAPVCWRRRRLRRRRRGWPEQPVFGVSVRVCGVDVHRVRVPAALAPADALPLCVPARTRRIRRRDRRGRRRERGARQCSQRRRVRVVVIMSLTLVHILSIRTRIRIR